MLDLSIIKDGSAQLEGWIKTLNPSLVVIDTLATFVADKRPESSSSRDWTPIMQEIGWIARRHNVAILLVHHAKKGESGEDRDSTAIGAGVDLIIKMKKPGPSIREFVCVGRWETRDFHMRLSEDMRSYDVVGAETPLPERIINSVLQNPNCSQRSILKDVEGKAAIITKTLDELIADERLSVRKNGVPFEYLVG